MSKLPLFPFLLFLTSASLAFGQSFHGEILLASRHSSSSVEKYCSSFQFNAEVNNLISGWLVPVECVDHVKDYISSGQYDSDIYGAIQAALSFARNSSATAPKKAWVFDIDETSLSNLPYYADHQFGSTKFNATSFNEWVDLARAPAVAPTLTLFRELVHAKWKVIFLTGRPESQRQVTVKNLQAAGYKGWEKLLLKNGSWPTAQAYKSSAREKLVAEGYEIWGNVGDQWSDISGTATGKRVFKLPNPLYYIP